MANTTLLTTPRLAPQRIDVAVVAALVALVAIGTSQLTAQAAERPVDWLAYASGIVAAVSLVVWRRSPMLVVGIVSIALGVYLARRYPGGPAILIGPLAVIALGYLVPRRTSWLGALGLLAVSVVGIAIANESVLFHLLLFVGWTVAAVLTGQALAARDERAATERERITHAHERALSSERLRIAQDLHDSVAHAMATINVQSGVAAHLVDSKPEQAGVALEAIRLASRDALEELAAILGLLREPGTDAPLAPIGGLDQIEELVQRARYDGLHVALDQPGPLPAMSSGVGAAAYRCVQEALTNTLRHAGTEANVHVTITHGGNGSLDVTVADDGGQPSRSANQNQPSSPGGFGLVGMRERVEASGGTLQVGPASPAGFQVQATWPDRNDR